VPRAPEADGELFPSSYRNPLPCKLGLHFFRALPRRPGVYTFLAGSRVLYVGKAKDLRARLDSYRHASPGAVSSKVIRMIHEATSARFEECASEQAALLRENELILAHRPPYNRVGVRPESYLFVGLRAEMRDGMRSAGTELALRLTPSANPEDDTLFGAFRARAATREGYGALLRLLWAVYAELPERFEFPVGLTRERPPATFAISLSPRAGRLPTLVSRLLNGTSPALISFLRAELAERAALTGFARSLLEDDLARLDRFYREGPLRNRALKKKTGFAARLIPQTKLDALVISAGKR
jgi:hypothetical protein